MSNALSRRCRSEANCKRDQIELKVSLYSTDPEGGQQQQMARGQFWRDKFMAADGAIFLFAPLDLRVCKLVWSFSTLFDHGFLLKSSLISAAFVK